MNEQFQKGNRDWVGKILIKGVKGFIQKPYDFHQLLAKLRQIMDQDE